MKQIKIARDVGRIAGRGYVVSVNATENPSVEVGEVVDLMGKGPHIIKGIEMGLGLGGMDKFIGLVVKPFTEENPDYEPGPKTVTHAQAYVRSHREDGVVCPCCGQYCKVYHRTLNSAMAQFLIWLVLEYEKRTSCVSGNVWINVNDGPLIQNRKGGGDFAKLRYWGLIEQMANEDETKRTSGYWRPTQTGIDFVYDKVTVPKKVRLYLNEPIGFAEERVTIQNALGTKFNYQELMARG